MKNLLILLFLVGVTGLAVGQSCHAKSAMATASGCCAMKAAALVAADQNGIEVRKSVATGDVSYFKKSTCAHSGTTSYVEVIYDSKESNFVNKAPSMSAEMHAVPASSSSMEMKKMDCSKMSKAECLEKMAKGECQMKAKT